MCSPPSFTATADPGGCHAPGSAFDSASATQTRVHTSMKRYGVADNGKAKHQHQQQQHQQHQTMPPKPPAKRKPQPPALPLLSAYDLIRVEGWARQGIDTITIASLLGLTRQEFEARAKTDARIYESLTYGRAKGIAAVAKSLFGSATSGRDSGAARFYLERIGRGPLAAATWAGARGDDLHGAGC